MSAAAANARARAAKLSWRRHCAAAARPACLDLAARHVAGQQRAVHHRVARELAASGGKAAAKGCQRPRVIGAVPRRRTRRRIATRDGAHLCGHVVQRVADRLVAAAQQASLSDHAAQRSAQLGTAGHVGGRLRLEADGLEELRILLRHRSDAAWRGAKDWRGAYRQNKTTGALPACVAPRGEAACCRRARRVGAAYAAASRHGSPHSMPRYAAAPAAPLRAAAAAVRAPANTGAVCAARREAACQRPCLTRARTANPQNRRWLAVWQGEGCAASPARCRGGAAAR